MTDDDYLYWRNVVIAGSLVLLWFYVVEPWLLDLIGRFA